MQKEYVASQRIYQLKNKKNVLWCENQDMFVAWYPVTIFCIGFRLPPKSRATREEFLISNFTLKDCTCYSFRATKEGISRDHRTLRSGMPPFRNIYICVSLSDEGNLSGVKHRPEDALRFLCVCLLFVVPASSLAPQLRTLRIVVPRGRPVRNANFRKQRDAVN